MSYDDDGPAANRPSHDAGIVRPPRPPKPVTGAYDMSAIGLEVATPLQPERAKSRRVETFDLVGLVAEQRGSTDPSCAPTIPPTTTERGTTDQQLPTLVPVTSSPREELGAQGTQVQAEDWFFDEEEPALLGATVKLGSAGRAHTTAPPALARHADDLADVGPLRSPAKGVPGLIMFLSGAAVACVAMFAMGFVVVWSATGPGDVHSLRSTVAELLSPAPLAQPQDASLDNAAAPPPADIATEPMTVKPPAVEAVEPVQPVVPVKPVAVSKPAPAKKRARARKAPPRSQPKLAPVGAPNKAPPQATLRKAPPPTATMKPKPTPPQQ